MSKETVDQTVHARIVRKPEPPHEVSFTFWRNRVLEGGMIVAEQVMPISLVWEPVRSIHDKNLATFVLPETASNWLDVHDSRAGPRIVHVDTGVNYVCEGRKQGRDVHSLLADAESDTRAIEAEVNEVLADCQARIEAQQNRLRKVLRALDYPEEMLVSDGTDKED